MVAPEEPLHPFDLGLILSYRCLCNCAHCLYNCGSTWNDWMSMEAIYEALEATRTWIKPQLVHFTGGEPFLNFPLLHQAVTWATEMGILSYVETNASWCTRESFVRERFASLKNAGMPFILISCSPFHAEIVPPKRTLMAIAVAMEIFGSDRVIIYLPEWLTQITRFGVEHPIPLERYIETFGRKAAGVMFWQGYELISGGRSGYQLGELAEHYHAENFQPENCQHEVLFSPHAHFDLYGNLIPWFCGGLSLGDWHSIPHLIASCQTASLPPLVQVLVESGPYGLYEIAKNTYGYKNLSGGYVGKCHLCVDVRRHLHRSGDFTELKPKKFYEVF
jgi:hypothetical protein